MQPIPEPKATGDHAAQPGLPPVNAPEGADKVRFVLHAVVIDGARVFGTEEFRPLYASNLDHEISVKDIYALAAAITAKYTSSGYILAQAVVVPQEIGSDGIIHLHIVEGYVSRVIINGNSSTAAEALLQSYGDKIKTEHPLRLTTLERYLLLASDLPGATAKGTLRPSATPGASDLIFEVTHTHLSAVASVDNRGSRYLGPWRAVASVGLNGLLSMGDQTELTYAGTPTHAGQLKYGQIRHSELLDDEGTTLAVDGNYTQTHAGYTLQQYNIRGIAQSLGVEIRHPFIRSRTENLSLHLRFDMHNSQIKELGTLVASDDRLRTLRLGADYDWADSLLGSSAINQLSLEGAQGLNILSNRKTGSENASVPGGHSDFTTLDLNYSRLQPLNPSFALKLAVSGQISRTTLLSSETFVLGGAYGSGYDQAVLSGDDGVAGKIEAQYYAPNFTPLLH
ncbi:MAG: ShlB/FhaC/HecB family hemolysin secretion/activation protein [Rhizomicrobium sp.]